VSALLRGLLDRALLLVAVVGAGCVPGFVAQYRQRVGGALQQAVQDLAPFEDLARRHFGGDLGALVSHHRASTDPVFRDEAQAIQAIVDAIARLRAAVQALDTDVFGQVAWLVRHVDPALARGAWADWTPVFPLTTDGVVFALAAGVAAWIVFVCLLAGVAWLLRGGTARGRPAQARDAGSRARPGR
jgi:hypothetical protein